MPAGPRIRGNNAFGLTTDNPLTAAATTFNSLALPTLPTVAAAHAVVVLDPKRVFGAPEIVVVTAHTAAATVATISRGAYGTVARSHPVGTSWAHIPVDEDYIEVLTSATRPIDPFGLQLIGETDTDKFVARNAANTAWVDAVPLGAWVVYSPVFTNVTLGTGPSVTGFFTRFGRTVHWWARVVLGTGGAVAGAVSVTLPVSVAAQFVPSSTINQSHVTMVDATGGTFPGNMIYGVPSVASATAQVWEAGGTYVNRNALSSTVPFTWTVSDSLHMGGTYEAAA